MVYYDEAVVDHRAGVLLSSSDPSDAAGPGSSVGAPQRPEDPGEGRAALEEAEGGRAGRERGEGGQAQTELQR